MRTEGETEALRAFVAVLGFHPDRLVAVLHAIDDGGTDAGLEEALCALRLTIDPSRRVGVSNKSTADLVAVLDRLLLVPGSVQVSGDQGAVLLESEAR